MTNEAYVSFEIAQLLKEKGFDWNIDTAYLCSEGKWWDKRFMEMSDDVKQRQEYSDCDSEMCGTFVLAPTQQMACRWLREEEDTDIIPVIKHEQVFGGEEPIKLYSTRIYDVGGNIIKRATVWHKSFETAVEEALKYCLTKLI